jgi:hypothetical protein
LALDGEHVPQALLEQVGTVQSGIGPGDPRQHRHLVLGEVPGVLPQRIPSALQGLGAFMSGPRRCAGGWPPDPASGFAPRQLAGVVTGLPADLIEGVGGPRDDVERVRAAHRRRARAATTEAIQSAASAVTWVIWAH